MDKIDKSDAIEIAINRICDLGARAGYQFELLQDQTIEVDLGWLFFFNTSEFIRTGDPSCELAGNGPILVLRTGEIRQLPSSSPWEESLRQVK